MSDKKIEDFYETSPPGTTRFNNNNYICLNYCPRELDHLIYSKEESDEKSICSSVNVPQFK
jgi:hypothetical protein